MAVSFGVVFANHLQEAFLTKNWCGKGLIPLVETLTWQQATAVPFGNHSTATLVYHVQYYLQAIRQVLQLQTVTVTDAKSFDVPNVETNDEWQAFLQETKQHVQETCLLLQEAPTTIWETNFIKEEYGTVHHNIMGILNHVYYHMGQIVLLQKSL